MKRNSRDLEEKCDSKERKWDVNRGGEYDDT